MTTAEEIHEELTRMADPRQAAVSMRFFKCGKGQYGEGDRFLGLKNPQTRMIVKAARLDVPLDEILKLIRSPWHEARLCGFLLLVEEMTAALPRRRERPTDRADRRQLIARFYLRHARRANNWDLVDLSCTKILGPWLLYPSPDGNPPDRSILYTLAASDNLWEQRIAIVTTWSLIRQRQFDDTLRLAELYLDHHHDLIHKATGWMLREVGKKDISVLTRFLERNYNRMPRTMLRYAIEKMPCETRRQWLCRR